jgi:hypothetical protein
LKLTFFLLLNNRNSDQQEEPMSGSRSAGTTAYAAILVIVPFTVARPAAVVAPTPTALELTEVTASSQSRPLSRLSASSTLGPTVEQKFFVFGYLEFDWDPRLRDGLPGFDTWQTPTR